MTPKTKEQPLYMESYGINWMVNTTIDIIYNNVKNESTIHLSCLILIIVQLLDTFVEQYVKIKLKTFKKGL